jgi:hypothetical protein
MAGLVPAIHAYAQLVGWKTWMPGTRPGMTKNLIMMTAHDCS